MPIVQGVWVPLMFQKQMDVFNCYKRAVLLTGPRLSGKTRGGILNKICRHLWETPDARIGMFTKILKNSKDAGTWALLHKTGIPEWVDSGIGFNYTTTAFDGIPGPKVDGQTRTPFFRVRNMYGGESEMMLFSLDNDNDIESKLKEREFSMIYFSELSNFMDRKVLSMALLSLRMAHLKYQQMQWIADTNPSEEGESSWIYQVWYKERTQTYEQYHDENTERGLPTMKPDQFEAFQKGLALFEFKPKENPYLDPRQIEELETTYSYDAGLYARYVEGKWVYGDGDSSRHFRSFFKKNIHVLGTAEGKEEDWETIIPSNNCMALTTGWDLGDTNHAACVLESQFLDFYVPTRRQMIKRAHFSVVDELVTLQEDISNEEFTEAFMEMIGKLEKLCGRSFDLENSWSDRSSIEKYSATGDTFPYLQVHAASGGRIMLKGVPKAHGSVRARVQLLKQLLAQNRIKVSAHCTATIRMLEDLKKGMVRGNSILNYVVPDENKHIFDALTYALLMECSDELTTLPENNVGRRGPLLVSVG